MSHERPKRPLPPDWRWAKLGELFDVQQGVAMSPYRRQGMAPRPFLRTLNVLWHNVDLSALDQMDFTDGEVAALALRAGDLLVCEGGEVGRTAIWRDELDLCLHQNHIHRLRRRDSGSVPEFFAYWMDAAFRVLNLYRGQWGETTIANLSGGRLKGFQVPVPPHSEQRRIAARLSEQMAQVERARRAAEAELEAAKALPAAFFRQVFESEEAKAGPKSRLGDICALTARQVDPTSPEYRELPHISSENIESGTCRLLAVRTAAEDGMTSGKYIFCAGDVLYSKIRPYLRKAVPVEFDGLCSADIYPLKPARDTVDPRWFAQLLVSDSFTQYADAESKRVRIPKLNRNQLFSWEAHFPPLDVQRRLSNEMSSWMAYAEKLQLDAEVQLEAVNAISGALLEEVFGGFELPT